MKNNRKLTKVLALLLIAIWGAIGYQIVQAVTGEDGPSETVGAPVPMETKVDREFKFTDEVRNPFRFSARKREPVRNVTESSPWQPPPFRLVGIVTDKDKKTALLEGENGIVHFVEEGREVDGVTILRIKEKSVAYAFMKERKMWTLD